VQQRQKLTIELEVFEVLAIQERKALHKRLNDLRLQVQAEQRHEMELQGEYRQLMKGKF
jgi:hypothetical protein